MKPKKILLPLTLSKGLDPALAFALELASKSEAGLVLLHVIQLSVVGEERGIPRTRLLNLLQREAEAQLNAVVKELAWPVPIEIAVCEGRPAEMIPKMAEQLAVDGIVKSTHGYRGWLRCLHRKTAMRVVRNARCQVWLLVPETAGSAATLLFFDRPDSHEPGKLNFSLELFQRRSGKMEPAGWDNLSAFPRQ
jgi:nucleotide-binding universal stress UspA family protein